MNKNLSGLRFSAVKHPCFYSWPKLAPLPGGKTFGQIEQAKEFYKQIAQRSEEVRKRGKDILENLAISKHGEPVSEQEMRKIGEQLQTNITDPHMLDLLVHYYLFAHEGFRMPNSIGYGDPGLREKYGARLEHFIGDDQDREQILLPRLTEKIFDIVKESNDPKKIAEANQANLKAPLTYELIEGDFLRGGSLGTMEQIRKMGFFCREVVDPQLAKASISMNFGGTVSFGRNFGESMWLRSRKYTPLHLYFSNPFIMYLYGSSFLGRYFSNVASNYGAEDQTIRHLIETGKTTLSPKEARARRAALPDVKAAVESAVTYILKEQKNSYAMSSCAEGPYSDEYGVGMGVPSTEIKGVIVDATKKEAVEKLFVELAKFPFYVPVYDCVTGALVNEEMKKLYGGEGN